MKILMERGLDTVSQADTTAITDNWRTTMAAAADAIQVCGSFLCSARVHSVCVQCTRMTHMLVTSNTGRHTVGGRGTCSATLRHPMRQLVPRMLHVACLPPIRAHIGRGIYVPPLASPNWCDRYFRGEAKSLGSKALLFQWTGSNKYPLPQVRRTHAVLQNVRL